MSSLSDLLLEAQVTSEFPGGHEFLPEKALHEIITYDAVFEALQISEEQTGEGGEFPGEELVKYTLDNAKRVFATVVYVFDAGPKRQRAMQRIMRAKFGDRDLPVEKQDLKDKFKDGVGRFSDASDNGVKETSTWDLAKIHLFCTVQWQYIAPVFSADELHNNLAEQSILPLTKKIAEPRRGAFGQVIGYEVDTSHFVGFNDNVRTISIPLLLNRILTGRLPKNPDPPRKVAVKKIHGQESERQEMITSWGRELKILGLMNQLKQPHIVRFLTAFKRGNEGHEEHYLVLEWADGGNLREFWNTFERPILTADLVKATVHQILGLAEALNAAHNPTDSKFEGLNFRHGDLKPENILRFRNDEGAKGIGAFKIGDWGLAKQHNIITVLRNVNTSTAWGTRAYEPPEEASSQGASLIVPVPGQRSKKRSRLYDVWSMGCITLEFLIWLAYGNKELQRFNDTLARADPENVRFYEIKQVTGSKFVANVHPVANKWMNHMAQDPIFKSGETAMGNLLEIVMKCLLVVKLPQRLGTVDFSNDARLGGGHILTNNDGVGSSARNSTTGSGTTQQPPEILVSQAVTKPREKKTIEPAVQGSFVKGPERSNSKVFCDRMLEMTGGEFEGRASYWLTGQPRPAPDPEDGYIAPSQETQGDPTYGGGLDNTRDTTEPAQPTPLDPASSLNDGRTKQVHL